MKNKKYKILLLNCGYFKGHNGSTLDYVLKAHRYLFNSEEVENKLLEKFHNLTLKEKPDLICLAEIEKGKQVRTLANGKYHFFKADNKYGPKHFLSKWPFFHKNGNAFLAKKKLIYKRHFFKNGTKKLIYEIKIPHVCTVFFTHFSLDGKVRKKQFGEIEKLAKNKRKVVVCGDFNIFKGSKEVKPLIENLNLKLANTAATFPAFNPKKKLDLFLCSKSLKAKSKTSKNQISDHLPVILEITY